MPRKRTIKQCSKCGRTKPPDSIHKHHITKEPEQTVWLCSACHNEWHALERRSEMSFEEWIEAPPLSLLLAWLKTEFPPGTTWEQARAALYNSFDLLRDVFNRATDWEDIAHGD